MAKKKTTSKITWSDHLKKRLRKIRRRMSTDQLDGLLVSNPNDIRYITGFHGHDSWLLLTPRQTWIISDFRYQQELVKTCPFIKTLIRSASIFDALRTLIGDLKIKTLGFQADYVTVKTRNSIVSKIRPAKLKVSAAWLTDLRSIKDEHEIKIIRRAISIQQRAFVQLLDQITPGQTEQQIAAQLEFNMRQLGADGMSFPTIVAAGPNSSLPHYKPGRVKIRKNKPLLIDFGARVDGYCSDLTRTVAIGSMPPKIREIYNIVRQAQLAAIDAIKPGVKLSKIDSIARKIITKAGFGENFGHGLGHSIGLDIHEKPILAPRATGILSAGHILTIEPGVYLPGTGGVRIEDDVLVTPTGKRVLSSLPGDLESAII